MSINIGKTLTDTDRGQKIATRVQNYKTLMYKVERLMTIDSNNKSSEIATSQAPADNDLPPYDFVAALVCYVTRFAQMFIQVNLET